MNSIDGKIQDSQRWKGTQKNLDGFEKMMKIVKQYPIRPMERAPSSPPYTIPKPYTY